MNWDDIRLFLAVTRTGFYLSCFLGDADPLLGRYCERDPQHNLCLYGYYCSQI
jgi:hypothetical protein